MQIRHAIQAALACLWAIVIAPVSAQSLPSVPKMPESAPNGQVNGDVVNPVVFVPAVLYRSVFKDTPTGIETGDTDWKKANSDVGQFTRGHTDILNWEENRKAKP